MFLKKNLMIIHNTSINDLFIIEPKVFEDSRGYFFESFNLKVFKEKTNIDLSFVQDNQSCSQKNVLRGLHFQNPPFDQGKLVSVTKGSVLDVAVDIRKKSPTYGQHFKAILSDKNHLMMYLPPGMAHGFLTLEENTIFSYKCTNYYNKISEGCILWNDNDLNIDWSINNAILSEKDEQGENFCSFVSKF
jgi:dTDP-4-dehydrorhamnose 3,5-epimerase